MAASATRASSCWPATRLSRRTRRPTPWAPPARRRAAGARTSLARNRPHRRRATTRRPPRPRPRSDFILNLGDSFYDLGLQARAARRACAAARRQPARKRAARAHTERAQAGVNDPQWTYAYNNVFNAAGIPNNTPILSTLGCVRICACPGAHSLRTCAATRAAALARANAPRPCFADRAATRARADLPCPTRPPAAAATTTTTPSSVRAHVPPLGCAQPRPTPPPLRPWLRAAGSAAAQVAYTAVDPSGRWKMPSRGFYTYTFSSVSGNTKAQVVQLDSTVLHDRYLYSGSSGGAFATGFSGKDNKVNNPAGAIVLNPSVTAANGFSGNLYNASNFQCAYNFTVTAAAPAGAGVSGAANLPLGYSSGACDVRSSDTCPAHAPLVPPPTHPRACAPLRRLQVRVQRVCECAASLAPRAVQRASCDASAPARRACTRRRLAARRSTPTRPTRSRTACTPCSTRFCSRTSPSSPLSSA